MFTVFAEVAVRLREVMGDGDKTNYPFGPFEWADKIGIKHVCQT